MNRGNVLKKFVWKACALCCERGERPGGKKKQKNSASENVAYYRAEEKDCISAC